MNPTLIIVWLFSVALGIAGGWSLRGDHEDAKRLEAYVVAVEKKDADQVTVDRLETQQTSANADQAVKDRVITREVIRYVQVTPAAARCTLPGTWRVRHDAAATGEPGTPAELAADAAEPVGDDTALDTVAENYAACRYAIRQVEGWQAWCRSVGPCRE